METQRCPKCDEHKPQEDWHDCNWGRVGSYCRDCRRAYDRQTYATDPRRALVKAAQRRAAKRGVPFDLTPTDIVIPERCPVLGTPIRVGGGMTDDSPSLDRIIPALGYVVDNIVVVSWKANRIKSDAEIHELRKVADFYAQYE